MFSNLEREKHQQQLGNHSLQSHLAKLIFQPKNTHSPQWHHTYPLTTGTKCLTLTIIPSRRGGVKRRCRCRCQKLTRVEYAENCSTRAGRSSWTLISPAATFLSGTFRLSLISRGTFGTAVQAGGLMEQLLYQLKRGGPRANWDLNWRSWTGKQFNE